MAVDDRLINVEIQINPQIDYRERALFYWSRLYTSSLKKGESYNNLKHYNCQFVGFQYV